MIYAKYKVLFDDEIVDTLELTKEQATIKRTRDEIHAAVAAKKGVPMSSLEIKRIIEYK